LPVFERREVEAKSLYPVLTSNLPEHRYMLQDMVGSLLAVLAFPAVLYAPGYLAAHATNLFAFRKLAFSRRSLVAIAASFCLSPILAYLAGRVTGLRGLCWLLAACSVVTVMLLWRSRPSWPRRDRRITALIACGWTLFILLMLVDVQIGHKLYFSVVLSDQSYRIAFTDAVVRTGIPPANPLYFAGTPAPMRYYYFWYVLCAAVVKFAHVSARQSFIASTIWAGFGLIATVKLYTQYFFHWSRKQSWIAIGLLLVTGASLIPSLGNAFLQPSLNGDIEWWSVDPIDAWPDSLLWVPHHVAGVLCCLLAFLFLWHTLEPGTRAARRWLTAWAAVAFASAFGLSVYVAIGFVLLMLAWMIRLAVQRHPRRRALWLRVAAATACALILLAPFLRELTGCLVHASTDNAAASFTPSKHIFCLSVRRMIDSGLLTGLPPFAALNHAHPVLLDQAIRLVLLLPGLAMELGVYGAVLVLLLRARHRESIPQHEARDTALFFTVCGLIITMFLSSSVITNNDFGYRAVMLPQFFLLLLTADLLGSWWIPGNVAIVPITPFRKNLVVSLLVLGIAGSIYGAILLRAWLPLETLRPQNGYNQLPDDDFQIRDAFDTLNRIAPQNAIISFGPIISGLDRKGAVMTPSDFYQRILVMDTGRQLLNAEGKCATHFGGDPAACSAIQTATAQLYALPSPSPVWAEQYCDRFRVQYIVLSHRDLAWNSHSGWPLSLPVIAQEPAFTIYSCVPNRIPGAAGKQY
jgi:hypothetical protein